MLKEKERGKQKMLSRWQRGSEGLSSSAKKRQGNNLLPLNKTVKACRQVGEQSVRAFGSDPNKPCAVKLL